MASVLERARATVGQSLYPSNIVFPNNGIIVPLLELSSFRRVTVSIVTNTYSPASSHG